MYFDWDYYWRVLRHVWSLKNWPGRRRMLWVLLLQTPLVTAINTAFFLLDYVFFPRLWWQKVKTPVFIVGHARSGTTLMHRLMAADGDRFSYFLYWETFFPSLLQKKIIRGLGWLDAKVFGAAIYTKLKRWDDKTFGPFRHMHDMSLWNSEEDQFVMRAAFVTQQWSTDLPVLDVIDLFHLDQMPHKRKRWMRFYKECVKRQLLLNGGSHIHLSKNPVMSGWVGSLIETFPDARIVVMVRDPKECIPSLLKLVEHSWRHKGWKPEDYRSSLAVMRQLSFESFLHPAEQLRNYPRYCRVDYRELISNPYEAVHKAYRELGFDISKDYDDFLTSQSEREKRHQSLFEYTLDEFDLSEEVIESELAEFYEQYNWPRRIGASESA